ncbi:MAG: preprotein translocase subunit SecE [Patescibacteria group bacterium]|nr:preprotein translocase subunit SecE [Patescibacteria group bacterium]
MKAIIKFLHEAKTELMKVSWPSRQVAINLTLTVIAIGLVSALFIGGVDYLFTEGVKALTTLELSQPRQVNVPDTNIDVSDIQVDATPVE